MNARKTFLLVGIAVLAAVCVLQTLLAGHGSIETLRIKAGDVPDSITISRADGSSVTVNKSASGWTVGDKHYPADSAKVDGMIAAISSIKILGTVSGSSDYERYGLADGARVTATASKAGKTLRTVAAGKNSVTETQSYALVDGNKNVLLVSGSLKEIFDRGTESLRSHEIWSVPAGGITRIDAVSSGKNTAFSIEKTGSPAAWKISGPESAKSFILSDGKANAWAAGFAVLRAESFAPEGTEISDKPLAVFKIDSAGKQILLAIVSKLEGPIPSAGAQPSATPASGKYLCTSSESPYPFYIAEAAGAKLLAPYTSLGK